MIIQSKNVWISSVFTAAQIEMNNGKITAVLPYGAKPVDRDFDELRIIPGMIDVHCHGGLEFDTNDANPEGLERWSKGLLQEGITSFCPTTVTQSEEVLTKAVANVAAVKESGFNEGAEILGIHFEGPYLNKEHKGAQPEQYIVTPNVEQFKRYQKAAHGLIKIITVACEKDPDFALTHYCAETGVNVSLGHSGATYEEAVAAIANGARGITHTYNGMPDMHHREPGIPGAAMSLRDTYSELICDGNHVAWPAMRALINAKGRDHMIMIDDALCAKGCKPGFYELGGQAIEIRANGSAYLKGTDTLAGGTMLFNRGLQNLIEKVQIPMDWAINMSSLNPARYLKADDRKGRICYGYDADLAVLDRDYNVVEVYAMGKAVK
jgi:N-acetylglucosamine-6-phosphate deacetylase